MGRGVNRAHIESEEIQSWRRDQRNRKSKEVRRKMSQVEYNHRTHKTGVYRGRKKKQQGLRGSSQRVVVFCDSRQVISMQAEIVKEYRLSCTSPGIVVVFTGITTRLLLLLPMVTEPTPSTFTE